MAAVNPSFLSLDNILSAAFFFVGKWTPALKHNQSRDLLRFLLCRLYDQGHGRLMTAEVVLAQETLARKVGLSRTWTGILLGRLRDAGWLDYSAPVLADNMRGPCIFRIGNQLKRLLIMLLKAKPRKSPAKSDANSRWQFSPSEEEKRQILVREKENVPPSSRILARIPLLQRWMARGN